MLNYMEKPFSLVSIITIIIVAVVAFVIGSAINKTEPTNCESEIAKYKKVIDYNNPMPEEVFGVNGEITKIQDNVLSIETTVQDPYKIPEEWETKIVKVIIGEETRIIKLDTDIEIMPGEEGDKEIEISLNDLKVGDEIRAGSNENIKDKDEFTATVINLLNVINVADMPDITDVPE